MNDAMPLADDLTVDETPLDEYEGAVPGHVAIIMDGNGRWARRRDMPRIRGHHAGADSVRAVVEACRYVGVDVLTLYAFSTENWDRPDEEVTGLMTLLDVYIQKERPRLLDNEIRFDLIGDRSELPEPLVESVEALEEESSAMDEMLLQVAVSYGGREEIVRATRRLAEKVRRGDLDPDEIDEDRFSNELYTHDRPDPDLLVRTSGEIRLSNFLLWQLAYAEFYFTETLWPDFDEYALVEAFRAFDERERRYGRTGRQLQAKSD